MSTRFRLETFKFGMYVMFPIGTMYYFGTNLDSRFAVPDFWPKPENMNKVPMEREEMKEEMARLRSQRLFLREKRLEKEAREELARLREEEAAAVAEGRVGSNSGEAVGNGTIDTTTAVRGEDDERGQEKAPPASATNSGGWKSWFS